MLSLDKKDIPTHLLKYFRPRHVLKPKDDATIPQVVAIALRDDGWYLRQEIIWEKPNPMPESVTDRCTKAHEQLYLLAKRPDYFYDSEAIKEPATCAGQSRGGSTNRYEQNAAGMDCKEYSTRNKRSVWTIQPAVYKEAHFATFPPALVEPCILAGTSEAGACPSCGRPWERIVDREEIQYRPMSASNRGNAAYDALTGNRGAMGVRTATTGWRPACSCSPVLPPRPCVVLDPFVGSGTTLLTANRLGRAAVGCDLSADYLDLASQRIARGLRPQSKLDAKPFRHAAGQSVLFE